ncbi:hypothetical protein ACTQ4A_06560 [Bifidobacterium pseudolongum]|uniref:hypothetical protein n=1 Tax=Bifidobacterium pseudolongum TaxID=1694 RepID=UPI000C706891|nr:hypothetical protein [Bifidobacterium pseudolongum]
MLDAEQDAESRHGQPGVIGAEHRRQTADKPPMNTTAKETSRMLLIDMAKMRRAFVRGSVVAFTFAHSPWASI